LQGNDRRPAQPANAVPRGEEVEDEEFLDAQDFNDFETAPPNTNVDFETMAQNYFSRVDEIHQQIFEDEDAVLDFDDVSTEEDECDDSAILEEVFQQVTEPLFDGSSTSRMQFNIILMSLCTLFPSVIIALTKFLHS